MFGLGYSELIMLFVIALLFVYWIWMLVDCLRNPALQGTEKIVWVLVILLLNWLGAAIYYWFGPKKRT